MTPDDIDKMMLQIVLVQFRVEDVERTWELNQNKPNAVRLSAADHVEQHTLGSTTARLARCMESFD